MMLAIILVILLQANEGAAPAPQMTTGGWIFMAGAWAGILTLVYFTFSKVLRRAGK